MPVFMRVSDAGVVNIDPSSPGITIPDDFVGFSFEVSYVTLNKLKVTNTALVNFFKQFNAKLSLRVGGNTSDLQIPPDFAIDDMCNFVVETGCTLIYGLPGRIIAPSTTDEEQATVNAAIAARIAAILDPATDVLFQIGNEPNFAGESYATYASRWGTIRTAVLAAVPEARFAGSDDGVGSTTRPDFLAQFIPDKGGDVEMYSVHRYCVGNGQNDPAATIPTVLANDYAEVDAKALRYWGGGAKPIRVSEAGTLGGSTNQTDAPCLGCQIWTLRTMALLAKTGWAGINWHGNEFSTQGYSPCADHNNGTWNDGADTVFPGVGSNAVYDGNGTYRPQGVFYAMLLFHALVGGQVLPTTANLPDGCALGVTGDDGANRVLVINRDLVNSARYSLTSSAAFTTALATIMTASDYTDRVIYFGGAVASTLGLISPSPVYLPVSGGVATLTLPPASSAVVKFG